MAAGALGDMRAVKPITQALHDPDPGVQKAALEVLAQFQATKQVE